jgi:hypothetical protein
MKTFSTGLAFLKQIKDDIRKHDTLLTMVQQASDSDLRHENHLLAKEIWESI